MDGRPSLGAGVEGINLCNGDHVAVKEKVPILAGLGHKPHSCAKRGESEGKGALERPGGGETGVGTTEVPLANDARVHELDYVLPHSLVEITKDISTSMH